MSLQDDGVWSADADPELDFSGSWPGHSSGELLQLLSPDSLIQYKPPQTGLQSVCIMSDNDDKLLLLYAQCA